MHSWGSRGSLVRRAAAAMRYSAATKSPSLCYSSSHRNRRVPIHQNHEGLLSHTALTAAPAPAAVPAQTVRPRGVLKRTSLLEQLRDCNAAEISTSDLSTVPAESALGASGAAVSLSYISSSEFVNAPHPKQKQLVGWSGGTHSAAAAAPPSSLTASAEMERQQHALRDAFKHARQYHNVRLPKDPGVYRAECRAFRQAHRGRLPTQKEVSRTVAVPLAPVAALKTLAHTDATRSSLHASTKAAVMLHNAVVKNELVKSSTPQLVRCLRCFHVYMARPRTLWGGEVEQSSIEYEEAKKAQRLQRVPPGKRANSVGRRRREEKEDPTCCPKCHSPRAQWMMEYVHHHTHERA
ncbi:hypothetical protein, conserved [Leishmania tarentolae]|uniref:Uncharacterized protein n=1 Tax=Leishmania tarentolae TaxID=5689 RepID=A0A640KDN8_LEITA|nr:hypothetical protein, conserved [Leishmania tarentolae]